MDDRAVRGRLVVASLSIVLHVAYAVVMTVVFGMVESWWLPIAVAAVFVMWAVLVGLTLHILAGLGDHHRRRTARTRWDLGWDLLMVLCTAAGVQIGASGVDAWRGDLPALLVVGLVAAAPLTVAVAVRSWWWSSRAAAARARQDRSADGDADPGRD